MDEVPGGGRGGAWLPGRGTAVVHHGRVRAPASRWSKDDLRRMAGAGLAASPTHEVLIEESILGWKEFELELMRDSRDNVVVVCSIENIDPMGVHTGDSVTVAPAMTLTDREYQRMRDTAIAIMREVGVDTGGCNIQFAVDPRDRPHGRDRDEPAGVALVARWRPRRPASRSPRSPPSSPSATRSTRSPTTSPGKRPACFEPDARLRGGQGPAVRVREVPRRRSRRSPPHEVGG